MNGAWATVAARLGGATGRSGRGAVGIGEVRLGGAIRRCGWDWFGGVRLEIWEVRLGLVAAVIGEVRLGVMTCGWEVARSAMLRQVRQLGDLRAGR
ncbi:hypothetical protein GCM10010483_59490 [Actinokineospora diospyrosa]